MFKDIEEYYKSNRNALVNYIYRKVGKYEDAEDILHNAFYRAMKWKHTRGESMEKWMFSIIENCIKDFKKKEKGAEVDYVFDIQEEQDTLVIQDVDKYLDSIKKPLKKEVLRLYLVHNLKMVEIYRLMNIPYSTVKTIVTRFRKELKDKGYV